MNATVAAHKFKSKLVLMSGTDFSIGEMREGGYEDVVYCTAVKSLDRRRGEPTRNPEAYCNFLQTEVKRAVELRNEIKWTDIFEGRVEFEVHFKRPIPAGLKDGILNALMQWTEWSGTVLEDKSACFHAPGIYEGHAAFHMIMWHLRNPH